MGSACSSNELSEQKSKNRKIENNIEKDKIVKKSQIKLLLLGTGECGKSTILKQMRILHNNGFTEKEYEERRIVALENILSSMVAILDAIQDPLHLKTHPTLETDAKMVRKFAETDTPHEHLTGEVTATLKRLWADETVQTAFQRRNEYQLHDSSKYFLDALDRVCAADYKPTEQDILRTRVATTGVVQVDFAIKGSTFRVYDVGGQRSERRKWIHLFDDAKAIIYIAAINEYDQVLMEDNKTNRLTESMHLFAQILNSPWFDRASMILFLNKTDLFKDKLQRSSIKTLFKEYNGSDTYEESVAYIRQQFLQLNKSASRQVYTHESCATDTNQVQLVIDSVVDSILLNIMKTMYK